MLPVMGDDGVRFLAFERRRLVVSRGGDRPALAALELESLTLAASAPGGIDHFPLGLPDAPDLRVVDLPAGARLPAGTELVELRGLLAALAEREARLAMRALHVVEWGRTNRFCGRCGTRNEELAGELARRCPQCGLTSFPRISPAVIMLVRRGERVLLGRGNHLPPGLFSTLAGFVEPGETLEEAVCREVREEVGIELGDVRYFGSQPWPFPDSLMVGFTAEHRGGEIRVDPAEIAEAGWFALDTLPPVPPSFSIARSLIDAWVVERGGNPAALVTWPG
jgi:NAD+ diphosphatase